MKPEIGPAIIESRAGMTSVVWITESSITRSASIVCPIAITVMRIRFSESQVAYRAAAGNVLLNLGGARLDTPLRLRATESVRDIKCHPVWHIVAPELKG
jgi:hypothetical protein